MTRTYANPDQSKTISVDASGFGGDGNLAVTDTDFQKVADKLDALAVSSYPVDSVIVVQHGDTDADNGQNLIDAYADAKLLTPGGSALAVDNRALIIVPAGRYDISAATSTTLALDEDFVDIIGHGVCRLLGNTYGDDVVYPDTVIESSAADAVIVTADDFLFKSILVHQKTSYSSPNYNCIKIDTALGAPDGRFIDVGMTQSGTSGRGLYRLTNGIIASYFENVHSEAGGICYAVVGGTISGTFIKCSANTMAYANSSTLEFSGYAEDCRVSTFAFGYSNHNAICSGTVIRCNVISGKSFGYSGLSGYYGVFSGYAEDCDCGTTRGGFGGSVIPSTDNEFSGTAIRCKGGDEFGSFGATGSVTATAVLKNCEAGEYSFGNVEFNGYGSNLKGGAFSFPYDAASSNISTGTLEDCELGDISVALTPLEITQPDPSLLALYDMESQTIYGVANQVSNLAWNNRYGDGSCEMQGVAGWSTPGSYCTLSKTQSSPYSGNQSLRITNVGISSSIVTRQCTTPGKVFRYMAKARGDGNSVSKPRIGDGYSQIWISPTYDSTWQTADVLSIAQGEYFYFYNSGTLDTSYMDVDSMAAYEYENIAQDNCTATWGANEVSPFDWGESGSGTLSKETDNVMRVTSTGFKAAVPVKQVIVGHRLRFAGQFRGDGVTSCYPRIVEGSGQMDESGTSSASWQDFDGEYIASSTTHRPYMYAYSSTGYAEFRNLSFIDLDAGASTHSNSYSNIFADGDMEAVGVASWDVQASAVLTKEAGAHIGTQCLRVAYGGSAAPGAKQSVLTIGKEYRARGWGRSNGTYLARLRTGGINYWESTTSTDWQYFDESFIATEITLHLYSNITGTGYVEWDQVEVDELDEYHTNATNTDATNATSFPTMNAMDFNGTSAKLVASTDVSPFAYQTHSIGCWFLARDPGRTTHQGIITNGRSSIAEYQYLQLEDLNDGRLTYRYTDGAAQQFSYYQPIIGDVLHFASATRVFNGTNTVVNLYLDGVLVDTDTDIFTPDVTFTDFLIGWLYSTQYFDGLIGLPQAYNEGKGAAFWLAQYQSGIGTMLARWNGTMRRCSVASLGDGVSVEGGDAEFTDCEIKVGEYSSSINALTATDTKVAGCRTNRDIGPSVTNIIENGYNTLDAGL